MFSQFSWRLFLRKRCWQLLTVVLSSYIAPINWSRLNSPDACFRLIFLLRKDVPVSESWNIIKSLVTETSGVVALTTMAVNKSYRLTLLLSYNYVFALPHGYSKIVSIYVENRSSRGRPRTRSLFWKPLYQLAQYQTYDFAHGGYFKADFKLPQTMHAESSIFINNALFV